MNPKKYIVITLMLLFWGIFCSSNIAKAEEPIYLYLHYGSGSNEYKRYDITQDLKNGNLASYIFSFGTKKGCTLKDCYYDKDLTQIIPAGASRDKVYQLYNSKKGNIILHNEMCDKITEDFHMYARWSSIWYDIVYELDGGENHVDNPAQYTINSIISLKEPTKEGYAFLGWYWLPPASRDNQLVQLETFDASVCDAVTLYAKWECLHTSTRMDGFVAATCCKSGYTGDVYCSSCSELIAPGKVQNPTGNHNITLTGQIDATCVTNGNTGGQYCINSGFLITPGSVVPATGIHDYNAEGKVLVEATKYSEGSVEYTCKHCSATKVEPIPKLPSDDEPSDIPSGPSPDVPSDNPVVPTPDAPSISDQPTTPDAPSTEEPSTEAPKTDTEESKPTTPNEDETEDKTDKEKPVKKPSKASNLKLKNIAGKKLKVSFKKQSGCKYQIQVSTDKKFKKSVKAYKISKTSYTVKKLKKGKKYYVRVRAYKAIDGKTSYGKWSSVKSITIKK